MRTCSRLGALLLLAMALVLFGASGCSLVRDLTAPGSAILPDSAVYMADSIPPEFRVYWTRMEDCSGLRRSFEDIQWFRLRNTINFAYGPGENVYMGAYDDYGNGQGKSRILVADFVWDIPEVIEHEILHALGRDRGYDTHPASRFGPESACGKLLGAFASHH